MVAVVVYALPIGAFAQQPSPGSAVIAPAGPKLVPPTMHYLTPPPGVVPQAQSNRPQPQSGQPADIGIEQAQQDPIQAEPLPPIQKQWQDSGQDPAQQTAPAGSADAAPAAGAPPAPDMTPMQRPNTWVPANAAKLQALDKVNAQTTALTVKVGQSATFGSLTITVKACVVRPADQPADAAAYLDVTDSHPDSPPFDGWMLSQEPSVSMMQHPIYDIRVSGCSA